MLVAVLTALLWKCQVTVILFTGLSLPSFPLMWLRNQPLRMCPQRLDYQPCCKVMETPQRNGDYFISGFYGLFWVGFPGITMFSLMNRGLKIQLAVAFSLFILTNICIVSKALALACSWDKYAHFYARLIHTTSKCNSSLIPSAALQSWPP